MRYFVRLLVLCFTGFFMVFTSPTQAMSDFTAKKLQAFINYCVRETDDYGKIVYVPHCISAAAAYYQVDEDKVIIFYHCINNSYNNRKYCAEQV